MNNIHGPFYLPLESVNILEKNNDEYLLEAQCIYGRFQFRSLSGPKPEREYLDKFDYQMSPDFIGDDPRKMDIGTVSPTFVETLEVRRVMKNIDIKNE